MTDELDDSVSKAMEALMANRGIDRECILILGALSGMLQVCSIEQLKMLHREIPILIQHGIAYAESSRPNL